MHYQAIRLYRSPEIDPTQPPIEEEGPGAPDRGIPEDVEDLLYMASNVSDKWANAGWLTIRAITQEDFAGLVLQAKAANSLRNQHGATKTQKTVQLKALDEQADEGTKKIKAYLVGKYEDEEAAMQRYPLFGMVQEGANWRLPTDRQDRLAALDIMLTAVASEGFGAKEFGTAFWTTLRTNYTNALGGTTDGSSTISEDLNTLNPKLEQIRKVLIGLRYIIRGNYLDTYKEAWRSFGFLAENN